MAEKNVKKRNWAFVLYPESAPVDWKDRLTKTGLPCAISPLHDKDMNPTGEAKKSHYHILLCYSGPTAFSVVERLTKGLNQPIPQAVEQIRGYYRYLTHEDNPEKAQYSKSDIQTLNGFDIRDFVEMSKSEATKFKRELVQFIQDNNLMEYADLLDALMAGAGPQEWFDVASSNTLFFTAYLKSRRFRVDRKP
ncbi:MAG: replication protein [Oscillospiraceae bacterium]|nr:replication protein [Oscillospiraceae bacterium]